jgi:solute carrier family 6 (neurotransmitter transporter, serotonin) member 4
MEGLYTALVDEFSICRKHKFVTRALISIVPFITSLPTVTYGGIYVVQWLDKFAISPSVLVVVFVEVVTVSWIYGIEKFSKNIKEMNTKIPYINWRISWQFLCPITLFTIVLLDVAFFEGIQFGSYEFPRWSIFLGYFFNFLALIPIPGYALIRFLKLKFTKT